MEPSGHKLSSYISRANADYVEARRIINGTDRAEVSANYASKLKQYCWSAYENIRIFPDGSVYIYSKCSDCLQPNEH
jgi:hypothetical protein